jgi:hypothetical protein
MADRGLITCYSQPIGKANFGALNYLPPPTQQGQVSGPIPKLNEVQVPNSLSRPTNRGTADAGGTLATGGGTKVTQYWG